MLDFMFEHRLVQPRILAFLMATLLPLLVTAQTGLSLQELITAALEQNYQIRIYKNITRISENNNTIGNAGMLPTVSLAGELRSSIRNSRQEFFTGDAQERNNARSNATSASLEVNWIVFDGLAMFARRDQLEKLELMSQSDIRFFTEQTVADLATAYYQLKQQNLLLDTYRKSLDVSRERLTFEEKAFEIGTSNMLNVQLAHVDCNTDSALIINQEARIQEIEISINRLINRDMATALQVTDTLRLNTTLDLQELLAGARNKNAALNQQQIAELIATDEARIAKGALFPQVELFGTFDYGRQTNEVGFLQSSRTFGPGYGIRVRFNLFEGRKNQIAHQNARIEIETEKLRGQELDSRIEEALRVAYLRWSNRIQQAELEQESVRAAARALEIARGQYELGALTHVEFRVIQLNVVNAETRFLEAQFEAKLQEIELLRLSGSLLETNL